MARIFHAKLAFAALGAALYPNGMHGERFIESGLEMLVDGP